MSSHDVHLILSPRAEDDFTDILQYTLETWGEHQLYVYRAVLDKALLTIQQNPQIGQQRPEMSPDAPDFSRWTACDFVSHRARRGLCLPYPA